jgi:hypothetical protein
MNIGDETGLIKLTDLSKRTYLTYGTQDRLSSVEGMSWLNTGNNYDNFAVIRANSCLEAWKYEPGGITKVSSVSLPQIENPLNVLTIEDNRVICVGKSGSVQIMKFNGEDVNSSSSGKKKEMNSWETLKSFQVRGPVEGSASCIGGAVFGGRENDVELYDTTTQQNIWTARNVPYDTLRLRVPIYVSAISFLQPKASVSSAHFVTGTGHKHVRVYDVKASQQPTFSIDIGGEYRVTSIQPTADGLSVFVGDCSGIYINVYMYMSTYICICVYIHIYIYTYICVYIYDGLSVFVGDCSSIYIYMHINLYLYIEYVGINMYMYICTCIQPTADGLSVFVGDCSSLYVYKYM